MAKNLAPVTISANGKATKDKYEGIGGQVDKETATWAWVPVDLLAGAIVAATDDGAAVLLSKTSDGGALCLQVWNGAGRHKLYPARAAEAVEGLQLIYELAVGS